MQSLAAMNERRKKKKAVTDALILVQLYLENPISDRVIELLDDGSGKLQTVNYQKEKVIEKVQEALKVLTTF